MSAKTNDTIYLAIGGFAILGAGVWAFVQQSAITALHEPPAAPSSGAAYEPAAIVLSSPASETWAPAKAQTAGEKWIYDVFTPPKIYYNTDTKQFTVVPPVIGPTGPTGPEVVVPQAFGLQLVKVEQPLFRLQLVGYVGEGDQARGNFLNVKTGTVLLGTSGKKLPDLDLEIVRFTAERRVVQQPGGTTLVFTEATAVVRDTATGTETTLNTKVRTPEGPIAATFKLPDGTERTAKSGEVFTVGEHSYKIGEITLVPPTAVASKEGGQLTQPETQTLTVPPPAPAPAPAGSSEEPAPDVMPPGAFSGF